MSTNCILTAGVCFKVSPKNFRLSTVISLYLPISVLKFSGRISGEIKLSDTSSTMIEYETGAQYLSFFHSEKYETSICPLSPIEIRNFHLSSFIHRNTKLQSVLFSSIEIRNFHMSSFTHRNKKLRSILFHP